MERNRREIQPRLVKAFSTCAFFSQDFPKHPSRMLEVLRLNYNCPPRKKLSSGVLLFNNRSSSLRGRRPMKGCVKMQVFLNALTEVSAASPGAPCRLHRRGQLTSILGISISSLSAMALRTPLPWPSMPRLSPHRLWINNSSAEPRTWAYCDFDKI